jgi:hypothetical protein
MTRAGFAVAATALVSVAACTYAQAQTEAAPPESTIWDHNGSVVYLVANGSLREIYYQKPRPGMLDAGARPGSLLFRGEVNTGQYLGTAYIFSLHCGPIPFEVKGPILDDDKRIVLTGQAPRVGQDCRPSGSYTSNLEFKRLRANEAAQTQDPSAGQTPPLSVSKRDVPSVSSGESASTAQPPVKNETSVAAKDSSAGAADAKHPSTPIAQASVTTEEVRAKDLRYYLLRAGFIVMILWLLIVLFGKRLIRTG